MPAVAPEAVVAALCDRKEHVGGARGSCNPPLAVTGKATTPCHSARRLYYWKILRTEHALHDDRVLGKANSTIYIVGGGKGKRRWHWTIKYKEYRHSFESTRTISGRSPSSTAWSRSCCGRGGRRRSDEGGKKARLRFHHCNLAVQFLAAHDRLIKLQCFAVRKEGRHERGQREMQRATIASGITARQRWEGNRTQGYGSLPELYSPEDDRYITEQKRRKMGCANIKMSNVQVLQNKTKTASLTSCQKARQTNAAHARKASRPA